jgi:hypothetical protein
MPWPNAGSYVLRATPGLPSRRAAACGLSPDPARGTLAGVCERAHMSRTIVTGPSLTSSTTMRAPKRPVATSTPRPRRAAQNAP